MSQLEPYLQRIIQKIDRRWHLQGIDALTGRASLLRVSAGAKPRLRLILLTHSQHDRERNPQIARQEFQLLTTLKAAGLPVADALYLSETHQPPFLITSYVEGSSHVKVDQAEAFCRQLAASLFNIHSVNLRQYDLSYLPRIDQVISGGPDPLAVGQRNIHRAMQRAAPLVELNPPALLHGDFWLHNLLWIGEELAAIIDWEDAMLGDPLADLGKSRLEILWALGPVAMKVYTRHYLALNPMLNGAALPFWDLWGASRLSHFPSFAPKPENTRQMRAQYEAFVADAIRRLDAL